MPAQQTCEPPRVPCSAGPREVRPSAAERGGGGVDARRQQAGRQPRGAALRRHGVSAMPSSDPTCDLHADPHNHISGAYTCVQRKDDARR